MSPVHAVELPDSSYLLPARDECASDANADENLDVKSGWLPSAIERCKDVKPGSEEDYLQAL
jgi:hypothetical protein